MTDFAATLRHEASKMDKDLEYYMKLPYTIEMHQNPEDGWFVRVKELRGCMSHGETAEEAATMIREAMALWLEVSLERGLPIPEPRPQGDYSGKFVVRVPRSLHRELVEAAEGEGVSLNQYINVALAQAVGRARPATPPAHHTVDQAVPGLGPVPARLPGTHRAQAAMALHEQGTAYSDTNQKMAAGDAGQHGREGSCSDDEG